MSKLPEKARALIESLDKFHRVHEADGGLVLYCVVPNEPQFQLFELVRSVAQEFPDALLPKVGHRLWMEFANSTLVDDEMPYSRMFAAWRQFREWVQENCLTLKPQWNQARRQLLYDNVLCLSYTRSAPTMERVWNAFQELGWPKRMDDPLDPGQLEFAIKDIQKKLNGKPIQILRDGTGEGLIWKLTAEP